MPIKSFVHIVYNVNDSPLFGSTRFRFTRFTNKNDWGFLKLIYVISRFSPLPFSTVVPTPLKLHHIYPSGLDVVFNFRYKTNIIYGSGVPSEFRKHAFATHCPLERQRLEKCPLRRRSLNCSPLSHIPNNRSYNKIQNFFGSFRPTDPWVPDIVGSFNDHQFRSINEPRENLIYANLNRLVFGIGKPKLSMKIDATAQTDEPDSHVGTDDFAVNSAGVFFFFFHNSRQ